MNKTERIIIETELHSRVKAECAIQHKSIKSVAEELLEGWLSDVNLRQTEIQRTTSQMEENTIGRTRIN